MYHFKCEAGSYDIQVFANKRESLKRLVRKAIKICVGPEGLSFVMREYPSDYDTDGAEDFTWLSGKDFILLDGMEVVWVEGQK